MTERNFLHFLLPQGKCDPTSLETKAAPSAEVSSAHVGLSSCMQMSVTFFLMLNVKSFSIFFGYFTLPEVQQSQLWCAFRRAQPYTVQFKFFDVLRETQKRELCNNVFVRQGSALCVKLGKSSCFPRKTESFILSLWAIAGIIYVILCAAILLKLYYVPSQYAGVKSSK